MCLDPVRCQHTDFAGNFKILAVENLNSVVMSTPFCCLHQLQFLLVTPFAQLWSTEIHPCRHLCWGTASWSLVVILNSITSPSLQGDRIWSSAKAAPFPASGCHMGAKGVTASTADTGWKGSMARNPQAQLAVSPQSTHGASRGPLGLDPTGPAGPAGPKPHHCRARRRLAAWRRAARRACVAIAMGCTAGRHGICGRATKCFLVGGWATCSGNYVCHCEWNFADWVATCLKAPLVL